MNGWKLAGWALVASPVIAVLVAGFVVTGPALGWGKAVLMWGGAFAVIPLTLAIVFGGMWLVEKGDAS